MSRISRCRQPWTEAVRVALVLAAATAGTACVHMIGEKDVLMGGRPPTRPAPAATSLEVSTDDGAVLRGCLFRHEKSRFVVLYFGGNNEWVTPNSWIGPHGRRHGFDVYAVNYRGYGPSDGVSSLGALEADGLQVFDAVASRPEVGGRPVVVYGVSLGAVVALHVAAHRDVAGVVLEAPPTDMASNVPRARRALPWYIRPFVRLRAAPELAQRKPQPIDLARSVKKPLLVIHGTRDRVIAFRFGQELHDAAGSADKSLCPVERADHNTIWRAGSHAPHECLARFLDDLARRIRSSP